MALNDCSGVDCRTAAFLCNAGMVARQVSVLDVSAPPGRNWVVNCYFALELGSDPTTHEGCSRQREAGR